MFKSCNKYIFSMCVNSDFTHAQPLTSDLTQVREMKMKTYYRQALKQKSVLENLVKK